MLQITRRLDRRGPVVYDDWSRGVERVEAVLPDGEKQPPRFGEQTKWGAAAWRLSAENPQ